MNDAVAEIVKQLIRQYGTALVKEPRRVHALLMDCCWQYKREAFVLSTIVQAGMAGVILRDGGKTSPNILRPRLAQQLHDEYGIDQALADWAITAWADALSLTLPDEGQAQVPAPPQKRQRAAKHPAEELVAREAQQAKQRRQAAEQAARREQKSPPFIHGWDSAQVQHLQQTTARTLQLNPVFCDPFRKSNLFGFLGFTNSGPKLVIIPAGRFLMGSPEDEAERSSDERQHEVEIAQPFALGQYPVTFEEYDRFCAATGRNKPNDQGWGRGRRPVINVDWHDALAYCAWLSDQTGQTYRLPTEAEWEYACRAGTTTPFYFGDTLNTDQANYHGNYTYGAGRKGEYRKHTTPVGQFPANAWELYDMHGNVWEWIGSVFDADYGGAEQRSADTSESGDRVVRRVVRGGSWNFGPLRLRSAFRFWNTPDNRIYGLGFRISRSL